MLYVCDLGFDRSKRHNSSATTTVVSSSRWNPTPDQLETLEELFRQGTQSPTAEEIQHIAAKLRRYGKIEGKNVFYWFQNHKARERHKRRRKSDTTSHVGTDILENEQKSAGTTTTRNTLIIKICNFDL
ncbi:hypothetical protein GIB67_002542 [Kingdonia uniflora]|uniref:Homeobox domain-containing protein n=1 Tax=Kingdonia uniflora TaxID=39325 RepID=A0A7J7N8R4_9MAGN|nr:hypothetical protein GIB67_002542 [Kingdonia uniflora]